MLFDVFTCRAHFDKLVCHVDQYTIGPWLALWLIRTPDWTPVSSGLLRELPSDCLHADCVRLVVQVMPIFLGQFLLILLAGLAQGEPRPKRMGFQFLRLVGAFVPFVITMSS